MSVNSHSARHAEPRKRPVQERSRALVERVLDEAARIFEERGYAGTTTNHVAEAAGISIGSLYQYFPNKDALLVGLAERHLAEAVPQMEAIAAWLREERPSVEETCRAFVVATGELNRSDRLHRLLWQAPRTPALIDRLAALEDRLVDEVEWHLVRFGHPEQKAGLRARIVVEAVEAGVHGGDAGEGFDARIEELMRLAVAYVSAAE